jgi:hypothetical protein
MDRDSLPASDQLNYDLFIRDYEEQIEGHQYRWYLIPLTYSSTSTSRKPDPSTK